MDEMVRKKMMETTTGTTNEKPTMPNGGGGTAERAACHTEESMRKRSFQTMMVGGDDQERTAGENVTFQELEQALLGGEETTTGAKASRSPLNNNNNSAAKTPRINFFDQQHPSLSLSQGLESPYGAFWQRQQGGESNGVAGLVNNVSNASSLPPTPSPFSPSTTNDREILSTQASILEASQLLSSSEGGGHQDLSHQSTSGLLHPRLQQPSCGVDDLPQQCWNYNNHQSGIVGAAGTVYHRPPPSSTYQEFAVVEGAPSQQHHQQQQQHGAPTSVANTASHSIPLVYAGHVAQPPPTAYPYQGACHPFYHLLPAAGGMLPTTTATNQLAMMATSSTAPAEQGTSDQPQLHVPIQFPYHHQPSHQLPLLPNGLSSSLFGRDYSSSSSGTNELDDSHHDVTTMMTAKTNGGHHHHPVLMYTAQDDDMLSDYQIFVRRQIEFFEADSVEVSTATPGRKKPVVLGQVGIRCLHCSNVPIPRRSAATVYFPSKLKGLYQAAQNIGTTHLRKSCPNLPDSLRHEIQTFQVDGKRATAGQGGKQYWAEAARDMGIVEAEDGLRFSDTQP